MSVSWICEPARRGMRLVEVIPHAPLLGVRLELPWPELSGDPLVEYCGIRLLDRGIWSALWERQARLMTEEPPAVELTPGESPGSAR